MSQVERNSRVTLHYRLGTTEEEVLEDSFDDDPMTVVLGQGTMAEGLELALLGLREGDEQTIDIGPDLAFGHVDASLFRRVPRGDFAADLELERGLIIEFTTGEGQSLPGTIIDFDENWVHVDLNHPLAGQTVRYSVRIVSVENDDAGSEESSLH